MISRRSELIMAMKCPCQKCSTNPYIEVDYLLIELLLKLEKETGKQVVITSGNRCREYNKRIGGYWDSPHIPKPKGRAADIRISGMNNIKLAYACEKVGFKRIGIYPRHIHVDVVEPRPSRFWYKKSYQSRAVYSRSIKTLREFLLYLKKKGGLNNNDRDMVD